MGATLGKSLAATSMGVKKPASWQCAMAASAAFLDGGKGSLSALQKA